jgi:hypothetical protein
VLAQIGRKPFPEHLGGVDDGYLCCRLTLLGDILFSPIPLVAYRVHQASISHNILKMCGLVIKCYEALEPYYRPEQGRDLYTLYKRNFASVRRQYAKRLLGAGMTREARSELYMSLTDTLHPVSAIKSLGWLLLSYMPASLQPTWPGEYREWRLTSDK